MSFPNKCLLIYFMLYIIPFQIFLCVYFCFFSCCLVSLNNNPFFAQNGINISQNPNQTNAVPQYPQMSGFNAGQRFGQYPLAQKYPFPPSYSLFLLFLLIILKN